MKRLTKKQTKQLGIYFLVWFIFSMIHVNYPLSTYSSEKRPHTVKILEKNNQRVLAYYEPYDSTTSILLTESAYQSAVVGANMVLLVRSNELFSGKHMLMFAGLVGIKCILWFMIVIPIVIIVFLILKFLVIRLDNWVNK